MYLVDRELKALLNYLKIDCSPLAEPFNPDKQIQACSIDLRVDHVFWKPKSHIDRPFFKGFRRRIVDLGRSSPLERTRRNYWRRIQLKHNEAIILKPGQFILGRTCEEFTIPENCAGKIEGRSSFARLGLSVHCSGDFINPGYRGRMPLQLVNHSPRPIRIVPFLPISQLVLISLSKRPVQIYSDREPKSKYMNDDGGPSVWWKDELVQDLHKFLATQNIGIPLQDELLQKIGIHEPELILRFEKFVERRKSVEMTNADDLLHEFAKVEDRKRMLKKILKKILCMFAITFAIPISIMIFFLPPYTWQHFGGFLLCLSFAFAGAIAWFLPIGEYFGIVELDASCERED